MINTIKFIFFHPCVRNNRIKALLRYFEWQTIRFFKIHSKEFVFTSKTKLKAIRGISSSTGNYYCGLMEFEDMTFLLHVLDKKDLFVDIGANIGSYTVLASGEIGANSICFEPVNKTFNLLEDNLKLNSIEHLVSKNKIGIGDSFKIVRITNDEDSTNHVINNDIKTGESIEVKPLDDFFDQINKPTLIKIDVEGYELIVLKGGGEVFK